MNVEHEAISASVIEEVVTRLAANKRVRQALPGGGILHMDRLLPFLCVYRRNPARRDEGTARLVMSEASYLSAPGPAVHRNGLRKLIQAISETAIEQLGAFLVLEIWTGEDRQEKDEKTGELSLPRAEFRILPRRPYRPQGTVATMEFALQQIKVHRQSAKVQIDLKTENHPQGMTGLMPESVEQEIRHYQGHSPSFNARAIVRHDIFSGLLVAGSDLLIGNQTRINRHRAKALLQHEVGTHLVTYFNGASQPLHLLQVGLAGYDAMQEGLAVLSEFLVGGLTVGRLRTLAARVIAVDLMIQGKRFTEVFSQLVDEFGFEPKTAYTIALRVFRGGGLTKDSLYLKGLVQILDYLAKGGDIEPLLVGKIAVEHIPIVQELLLCGVLKSPPLRPRYLEDSVALQRLEAITPETTVLDLVDSGDSLAKSPT